MILLDHGLIDKPESSLQYRSPEVLSGKMQKPDSKSMVWTIGAIAFQTISKQKPFPQKSSVGVIQAIIFGKTPVIQGGTSARVKMMVASCMLQNPKHRPTLEQVATLPPHAP